MDLCARRSVLRASPGSSPRLAPLARSVRFSDARQFDSSLERFEDRADDGAGELVGHAIEGVRVLAENKQYAELEVVAYPFNTNAEAITGNLEPGDRIEVEYLVGSPVRATRLPTL